LSVSSSDSGKKADLGDIVVDSDTEGLDEFLNDTDTTPSAETVTQSTDKTEETISDDEDPVVVRSTDEVDIEDEYYEDDLGASHGDQEQYVDSEDMTGESDVEKVIPGKPESES
ncbi:uncharacterized protein LOC134256242, partial [Saccostrea cucullata]